jgi:hypothetical protein
VPIPWRSGALCGVCCRSGRGRLACSGRFYQKKAGGAEAPAEVTESYDIWAMASFGLNTSADFLQKLREERADFVHSKCLSSRHAVNAVMTAYHLCEWVLAELANRPEFEHKTLESFRETLEGGSLIKDAVLVANGTKHFKPEKIKTGQRKGAFQRGAFQHDAFDVSHLWLERNGKRQRAEDFIDELVQLYDRFFKENGVPQYAEAVGRSGRPRCQCGDELIDIDNRGEVLTGCIRCNVWRPLAKPPIRLSEEDLLALRSRRHGAT